MKKLLILFSFIISLAAKAQTSVYHPFPDSNAVWNMLLASAVSCNPTGFYTEYYSIIISGDTLINSTSYHRLIIPYVYYYNSDTSGQCYISPYTGKGNIGFIRQDTSLKRVYFVYNGSSTEHLLYDFSLHVGDSASYYCGGGLTYTIHVQKEDSIFIGSNYRKKWFIMSSGGSASGGLDSIIEGIGSISGLINHCHFFNPQIIYLNTFLECFAQNGNLFYPYSSTSCNILTSSKDVLYRSPVTIYPNPLTFSSTLQLTAIVNNAEVIIYDMLGKEMWRKKLTGNKMEIERGSLTSGIYFVKVKSEERQWVEKVIVE